MPFDANAPLTGSAGGPADLLDQGQTITASDLPGDTEPRVAPPVQEPTAVPDEDQDADDLDDDEEDEDDEGDDRE
jgi:hypothetical protein